VLEVMELRLAVEVEAAALAAERANRRQLAVIPHGLAGHRPRAARREGAVAEDFAFHRAIARPPATANPGLPRLLGSHVIPRQSVRLSVERRPSGRAIWNAFSRACTHRDRHFRPGSCRGAELPCASISPRSLERYRKLAQGEKNADASGRRIVSPAPRAASAQYRPLLAPLYPGLWLSDRSEAQGPAAQRTSSPPT